MLLAASAWAGQARAHDFWLEPSTFDARAGKAVEVVWRQGQHFVGESLPYVDEWVDALVRIDSKGREALRSELGRDPALALKLRTSGQTLIGFQSSRFFTEVEPELFLRYLREEGLEHVAGLRQRRGEAGKPARESFLRCAKLLIGRAAPGETIWRTALGFTLEIIPGADPSAIRPGEALPLKVLHRGAPVAGVLVAAFARERPETVVTARTDAAGDVALRLPMHGFWQVKAVHLVALDADPRARWESYWASLAFRSAD